MPGSGKSTCGVVAAKMLLKNFYDTDLLIQNIENSALQDIINNKGNDNASYNIGGFSSGFHFSTFS